MITPTPTHTAVPNVQATAPERIYLVIGEDVDHDDVSFVELSEVTWHPSKIHDNSIPYVRADLVSLPAPQGEQRDKNAIKCTRVELTPEQWVGLTCTNDVHIPGCAAPPPAGQQTLRERIGAAWSRLIALLPKSTSREFDELFERLDAAIATTDERLSQADSEMRFLRDRLNSFLTRGRDLMLHDPEMGGRLAELMTRHAPNPEAARAYVAKLHARIGYEEDAGASPAVVPLEQQINIDAFKAGLQALLAAMASKAEVPNGGSLAQ